MTSLTFFKALADETRLAILMLLTANEELCVCELTGQLQLSQPKISRHLAILKASDLILDRRAGVWIHYRLNPALPAWCRTTLKSCVVESGKKAAAKRTTASRGSKPAGSRARRQTRALA